MCSIHVSYHIYTGSSFNTKLYTHLLLYITYIIVKAIIHYTIPAASWGLRRSRPLTAPTPPPLPDAAYTIQVYSRGKCKKT